MWGKMPTEGGSESVTAVVAAAAGNLLIAVTKFIAAAFTGSSAMLSEGIHSTVDMGNGLLLLLGMHNSQKPADKQHPFGHGREVYFWTLVVAFSIFGIGGGVSIWEGVGQIRHPEPIRDVAWNYGVLGLSFIFEGITLILGWRAFSKVRRGRSILQAMHLSKDPTSFSVVLEDSAALLGLVVAFLGVLLGNQFGIVYFDGIASITIGALLCSVALFLGAESRSLLIGEALDPKTLDEIARIAKDQPFVKRVVKILSIYLGPKDVAVILELRFADGISAAELRKAVTLIQNSVRKKYKNIKRVYFEAGSLADR
jgi:cation diffusion facilitator family transporter